MFVGQVFYSANHVLCDGEPVYGADPQFDWNGQISDVLEQPGLLGMTLFDRPAAPQAGLYKDDEVDVTVPCMGAQSAGSDQENSRDVARAGFHEPIDDFVQEGVWGVIHWRYRHGSRFDGRRMECSTPYAFRCK